MSNIFIGLKKTCLGVLDRGDCDRDNATGLKEGGEIEIETTVLHVPVVAMFAPSLKYLPSSLNAYTSFVYACKTNNKKVTSIGDTETIKDPNWLVIPLVHPDKTNCVAWMSCIFFQIETFIGVGSIILVLLIYFIFFVGYIDENNLGWRKEPSG